MIVHWQADINRRNNNYDEWNSAEEFIHLEHLFSFFLYLGWILLSLLAAHQITHSLIYTHKHKHTAQTHKC